MINIPTPTPNEIEVVLVGMMDGTNAFGRWVKLDDAHLPFGGEETRVGDTMWWADVIDPDGVARGCCGGGTTPAEAAAVAWVEVFLGAWWCDCSDQSPEEFLSSPRRFRDLSKEEYLSVPRRVPDCYHFELYAVPAAFPGAERIQ
jgi:hypothetical protein